MFDFANEPKKEISKPVNNGPMSESKTENPEAKPDLNRLADIANQAATEESNIGFMQPGTKSKKGRGRPPGKAAPKTGAPPASPQNSAVGASPVQAAGTAQNPVPIQLIPTKKIVEPGVKLISRLGVGIADDARAAMSSDEINDISESLAMCMDKWMPSIMSQYSAEAALVLAVSMWGTRVYAIKQLKLEEKKAKQKAYDDALKMDQTPPREVKSDFSAQSEIKTTVEGYL